MLVIFCIDFDRFLFPKPLRVVSLSIKSIVFWKFKICVFFTSNLKDFCLNNFKEMRFSSFFTFLKMMVLKIFNVCAFLYCFRYIFVFYITFKNQVFELFYLCFWKIRTLKIFKVCTFVYKFQLIFGIWIIFNKWDTLINISAKHRWVTDGLGENYIW